MGGGLSTSGAPIDNSSGSDCQHLGPFVAYHFASEGLPPEQWTRLGEALTRPMACAIVDVAIASGMQGRFTVQSVHEGAPNVTKPEGASG